MIKTRVMVGGRLGMVEGGVEREGGRKRGKMKGRKLREREEEVSRER